MVTRYSCLRHNKYLTYKFLSSKLSFALKTVKSAVKCVKVTVRLKALFSLISTLLLKYLAKILFNPKVAQLSYSP